MGRRDDVVREAVTLLREGGPTAVTSVSVAKSLGVTQSAIYRHIRDIDELTTIAARDLVGELTDLLESILTDPDIEWGEAGDYERISCRLAAAIEANPQAFEVVDCWRFESGSLGYGIRELLAAGVELITELLHDEWATVHGVTDPFDDELAGIVHAHAMLLQDDVIAVARARRAHDLPDERATAELLGLRLRAGWFAFCLDVNDRRRVAAPELVFS